MLKSSADILRLLSSDPVISSQATVRVCEPPPPLKGEGSWIWVSQYPTTSDGMATWKIWIADYEGDLIEDVVVSRIRGLLPDVQELSTSGILELSTSYVLSASTLVRPEASAPASNAQAISSALELRLEEALERLEDQSLLKPARGKPGKPGEPGLPGKPGKPGDPGRDLIATDADLEDLKNVEVSDPQEGQVLMFREGRWQNLFVPKNVALTGGGGGGGAGNGGGNGGEITNIVELVQVMATRLEDVEGRLAAIESEDRLLLD